MKKQAGPVTLDLIKKTHRERRAEIRRRLREFELILETGSDEKLWEEMVFCFFTGGCSAKMGLRSIEASRHLLMHGSQPELADALVGSHRYPNARSKYITFTRGNLFGNGRISLKSKLVSFIDPFERRDWLVRDPGIKGLGYKEASHFLRNIGFKGYAILDKHVLNCLAELGVIDDPKPPSTRARYLEAEARLKSFARELRIDPDEMDLVLWSIKTGEILK